MEFFVMLLKLPEMNLIFGSWGIGLNLFGSRNFEEFISEDFFPLAIYQSDKSYPIEIMILHCHKLFIYNVKSQELRSNVVKE